MRRDAAQTEFEYYGNQKYYDVISSTGANTADVYYTPSYSDATAYVSTASYAYWESGDYDGSYMKEADNYAQKYGVKVNN